MKKQIKIEWEDKEPIKLSIIPETMESWEIIGILEWVKLFVFNHGKLKEKQNEEINIRIKGR